MSVSVAAPAPGRCGFFIERKKRFCKMIVGNGNVFCGEHANMEEGNERRRIPCPLDPKHTVFEERLSKHLKKCNSREKPKPVYYVEDVNGGSGDEDIPEEEVALCQRNKAELDKLLEKLKAAVGGLDHKIDQSVLNHPVLYDELQNSKNGDSAFKHLKQQASILGNMEALNLLGSNRCFVEFGAGRGKLSHWIHEANKASEDSHFLLVERSSTRFKVDGKNQQTEAGFERLQVDIQHLDLNKVPLLREKEIPIVGVGKHLCGAATDLALRCLFKSSEGTSEPPSKRPKHTDSKPETERKNTRVSGLTIALCCHHRCEWRHYVGKEFFYQRGLGAHEFAAYRRMSSWATCSQRQANEKCPSQDEQANEKCPSQDEQANEKCPSQDGQANEKCPSQDGQANEKCPPQDEQANEKCLSQEESNQTEEDHLPGDETDMEGFNSGLPVEERECVGRLCKLLIDQGRVHFLQSKGFQAKLMYYINTQVTLENVLLTAIPSAS